MDAIAVRVGDRGRAPHEVDVDGGVHASALAQQALVDERGGLVVAVQEGVGVGSVRVERVEGAVVDPEAGAGVSEALGEVRVQVVEARTRARGEAEADAAGVGGPVHRDVAGLARRDVRARRRVARGRARAVGGGRTDVRAGRTDGIRVVRRELREYRGGENHEGEHHKQARAR